MTTREEDMKKEKTMKTPEEQEKTMKTFLVKFTGSNEWIEMHAVSKNDLADRLRSENKTGIIKSPEHMEVTVKNGFQGTFLSNFWPVEITYQGLTYPSVENFYQAMKTRDKSKRQIFTKITAADAKKRGQSLIFQENWENLKIVVMTYGIRAKFAPGSDLAEQLLLTGNAELVEYNYWHDNFWGDCTCSTCSKTEGQNNLGKIIMQVRNELQKNKTAIPNSVGLNSLKEKTMNATPAPKAALIKRELLSAETQEWLRNILENEIAPLLQADISNYAPGRMRTWIPYFAPLDSEKNKNQPFTPGVLHDELWQFIVDLCAKHGMKAQTCLISKAGNIKAHRDTTYADAWAMGINLGKCDWHIASDRDAARPDYSMSLTGGEVFSFNSKHVHAVTNAAPDRWAINIWAIAADAGRAHEYDVHGRLAKMLEENPQVAEFIDWHKPGAGSSPNISRKENNVETQTNNNHNPKEGTTMSDKPIYYVAFTGHRPNKLGGYDPTNPIRRRVKEEIDKVLQRAIEKFGSTHKIMVITGGALGVDQDAASVAHKLGLPFIVAVPCKNQESVWPADAKARYAKMLQAAAEVVLLNDKTYQDLGPKCLQDRNEWMVDHCDALVAVWNRVQKGGTWNCIEYARKMNKPIVYINPNNPGDGGGTNPNPTPNNPEEGPNMKAEQPQNNNPVIETDNGKETKVSKKPISVDKWTTDIGLSVELKRSDDQYQKEAGRAWFAVIEGKPVYPKKEDGVIDELTARLWLNRKGLATMPEIKTPEVKPTEKKKETIMVNKPTVSVTLPNGVILNEEQSNAYNDIVNGHGNMLLTGNAGTGKSFVLDQAIKAMRKDNRSVVVCATTGIAATHINGKTYHSALRMFPNQDLDQTVAAMAGNQPWMRSMRHVELIVIDEVSMMHKDEFTRLDAAFRRIFDSTKPFGGKRLCLVGDFLQVEPVEKNKKGECNFVFTTKAWENGSFFVHQLKKVVRQQDAVDAGFLNNVRRGIVTKKMKPIVEQLLAKKAPESGVVHIVPTNKKAEEINVARLNELPGDLVEFIAEDRNPNKFQNGAWVENLEYWDNNTLVPRVLKVKVGATVINLINDWDKGLVNGDVGVIEQIDQHKETILVNWNRVGRIWMGRKKFHQGNEYTEYRFQIPLKAAWAITIHKSQGMTLDSVIVSSAEVFADGMCYVALSRVRTLAGLYLSSFDFDVVSANEQALDFYGLTGNLRGPAAEAECSIPDEDDNDDPNGGGGIDPVNPAPNNNDGGPELIVSTHEEDIVDNNTNNTSVTKEETPMSKVNPDPVEPQEFSTVNLKNKNPKEGIPMIKEYLVSFNIKPDIEPSVGRIITNDPDHWFKVDNGVVIEEINRGGYHYALLEHMFGSVSFAVNITAFKDPLSTDRAPQPTYTHFNLEPKDSIFGWADFDSETIFRVKGHGRKGWSSMAEFGLVVGNSEKMTKRLVELVRAARGYKINVKANKDKFLRILVLTHEQILKAFPHLENEFNAEKSFDGVSVMAVEKAKDIYRGNTHMSFSGVKKILKQMDKLEITNHTLRVLTNINGQAGEIKGNVITGKRASINARLQELGLSDGKVSYDIVTSVDNFKKELGTDGSWEIITLEPHHGPGMVKTNDQTMAQFWGIKGIFDAEELLEAFQTVVDDVKNRVFEGKDIEWTSMLRGERAVTEADKIGQATNVLNGTLNHMYATLNDLELPLGVSQTLMYMRANAIKKMFLSQTRNGLPNWTAPAREKKSFVYMPWAYRAYVMTKEVIYLAGYDIDMEDEISGYHQETQTFAMTGKLWAKVCGLLGGADLDDEIMVHVRKLKEKNITSLMALLIRTPNDWAEFALVDIEDFGPVTVDSVELPEIDANDLDKFNQTSISGQLPSKVNGSNRPKPAVWDWASTKYNHKVAQYNNGGVGNQVKTKMLQYAINNAPFNNLPCANEDMIDAIQQCKGDVADLMALSKWSTSMVGALLQGRAMDAYWWYSRNMYSTAKALKVNNFTPALKPEQSPIVRDLMIPREAMINTAFEEIFEFLKKAIVEIEDISDIQFTNKNQEMTIRKLINEQRKAFDVRGLNKDGRISKLNTAAAAIVDRMTSYKEKNGAEAAHMQILRMARIAYLMKVEMPGSNWDKWLYTVAPNSEIQMIDFLADAIIWYREKKAQ